MTTPTAIRPLPPVQRPAWLTALLLPVLCGVQFIDAFDVAAMGPALPEIQHALGLSPQTLQWVVTAYVLGYGGFLLLGGRLADLFDRKRLLMVALAVFVLASIVGGLATSDTVLIAARFVKGVTAAFTAPAALSILLHTYDDESKRHRALGAFLSISSIGFTGGLVLGGLMAAGTWRLVLLVPAALAMILLALTPAVIPPPKTNDERQRVDVLGALTVTTALLALVYGVSTSSDHGWGSGSTIASLTTAAILVTAFVHIQRVRRAPLVPLTIFRRPGLARGNVTIFLLQGSYIAWQFVATLYLQNAHGWSPLEVGLIFTPGGLLTLLTAQRWAGQVMRRGSWPIATMGMVLMLSGTLWTETLGSLDNILVFGVATVVMGLGFPMSYVGANISAIAGARPQEHGLASGLFIASAQVGSGVILGLVATVLGRSVHPDVADYRAGLAVALTAAVLATVTCLTGLRRGAAPRHPKPWTPDSRAFHSYTQRTVFRPWPGTRPLYVPRTYRRVFESHTRAFPCLTHPGLEDRFAGWCAEKRWRAQAVSASPPIGRHLKQRGISYTEAGRRRLPGREAVGLVGTSP
ncbi:MFS transporter [Streptomyces sp. SID9727]|uniref:MFS transporter n=1 Tax=Streptomyces sp. SID9727 TaxID=2706114 RepID=UPI0013C6C33C|nr:MFS transporter [Streptomyces sp. SID9727]NEC68842.1 MFS transporter [Streptomyces sp. SID9727]